jgi:hypothetical protein
MNRGLVEDQHLDVGLKAFSIILTFLSYLIVQSLPPFFNGRKAP